jgi:hypothetical protein
MDKAKKLKYHELADMLERIYNLIIEIEGTMCRAERDMFNAALADKGINCFDWKHENVWYISQLLRDMAPLEGG